MKTRLSLFSEVQSYRINNYWWRCLGAALFINLSFTATVFAQNKVWDETFGGSIADNFTSMIATPNGDYLLGGISASGASR